jgi:xylulokinase
MALFLGVDSGTQSTKVLIIDEQGNLVARGQAHYDLIEGLGVGHKEQHPQTWIDALHHACHDAINGGRIDTKEIVALGVSGQQHGFVPLDAKGAVIRPAKLWCDTATAPEADEIIARTGGLDALLELTGNGLPAGFTASKILWLKKHEPENYKRLATVLLPHDYINFHLTDRKRMEYGDASGTGLLDVRTRRWSEPVINAIDPALAGKLPPLQHSAEPCGRLRGGLAVQLGMNDSVLVSAGGGDNMMGAIGTGNVQPGIVSLSLGTSGTVYAYSQSPIIDAGHGEIAAFCDSTGAWLPLLCTMNVTVATELVKKTWKLDNNQLAGAAASVPAGAGGLVLLPYFEGERTPNVPDGTGVWFGYRESTHTAGHFARAAMEGATLGLAYGFQRLVSLGIRPREIRLTGGGSKSPLWRQIAADVFGVPVVCTTEPEGAALGAALQARWSWERQTNPAADIAALCANAVRLDETTRCLPNPANRALYDKLLRLQIALKDGLAPAFAQHRQLIG